MDVVLVRCDASRLVRRSANTARNRQRSSYAATLGEKGYGPKFTRQDDAYFVRIRQAGRKSLSAAFSSADLAEQSVKTIEVEQIRGDTQQKRNHLVKS